MILVTGGAGFIGSAYIWYLNEIGRSDIVCVDHWREQDKWKNIAKRDIADALPHIHLFDWLKDHGSKIEAVVHMGACSSTTEKNVDYLLENNLGYSQKLFDFCARANIPFVYASSAATYGNGEHGYSDSPKVEAKLRPINPYGLSKHLFDRWVRHQVKAPEKWSGLKFFNVFGPNEYHKGSMSSLVGKAIPQIHETGAVKLFRSHKDGFKDGEQLRDFVYVKDVVKVIHHFVANNKPMQNGVYNVGTGKARSFYDLMAATFAALNKEIAVEWVDMPMSIRNQYQYFTEADLGNLRENTGYNHPFQSLEEGVQDYVQNYLINEDPYL